jgi:hypothetical protein
MYNFTNLTSESKNKVFCEESKGDYVLKINPIISTKRYLDDGVKLLTEIENVGDAASPQHIILFHVEWPDGSTQEKKISIPSINPESKHVGELINIRDRRGCTRYTIKDVLTEKEEDKMKLLDHFKKSTNEERTFKICFLNLQKS